MAFLERNREVKIYAMEQALEPYYSNSGGKLHYIGISEELLTELTVDTKDRFRFSVFDVTC